MSNLENNLTRRRGGRRGVVLLFLAGLLTITTLCLGCDNARAGSRLHVELADGPFSVGDSIKGRICVTDHGAVFTQYFMVNGTDTFRLPLEEGSACASIMMTSSLPGKKVHRGFARMEMPDGVVVVEPYIITYQVE